MRYKIKIKIRVNSSITNTTIEIDAPNATMAKALAEDMHGVGSVLSVIRAN